MRNLLEARQFIAAVIIFSSACAAGCGVKCEYEDNLVFQGQTAMKVVTDEFGNERKVPHRCVDGTWHPVSDYTGDH